MDNTGDKANDSMQDTFKGGSVYSDLITPILTKNVTDHSITRKVKQKLEKEKLKRSHEEIDEKISNVTEILEKTKNRIRKVERELYNAVDTKNQAIGNFEKTGEMMNLLKDEAEKLRSHGQKLESRRLELEKKFNELTSQKIDEENAKKKIEQLELEITNVMNAPIPQLDKRLIKQNEELKNKLAEQRERIKSNHEKKQKINELNKTKIHLMEEIIQRIKRNTLKQQELEQKKAALHHEESRREEKLETLQNKLSEDNVNLNKMINLLEESVHRIEERKNTTAEIKASVELKENAIKNIKENIEKARNCLKDESDKLQNQFKNEQEKLQSIDEKFQYALIENKQKFNLIAEASNTLMQLKDTKCNKTMKLHEAKQHLAALQREHSEMRSSMEILSATLTKEKSETAQLKARLEEEENKLNEYLKQLNELPFEAKIKYEKVKKEHKDKTEALLKEENLHKATVECLQLRLDDNMKKIDKLVADSKALDEEIKWQEQCCERKQTTFQKLKEKITREQAACEKLESALKQKEDKKHSQKSKEDEESYMDDEETTSVKSGRKSPGILKSPTQKATGPILPQKRVTFIGISSTESSSASGKSPEENKSSQLDELLKDWSTSSYKIPCRNRDLDF